MAYSVVNIGGSSNKPIFDIRVDTESDIASLVTETIPMGSIVYVIGNGKLFMLNSDKQWIEQ